MSLGVGVRLLWCRRRLCGVFVVTGGGGPSVVLVDGCGAPGADG